MKRFLDFISNDELQELKLPKGGLGKYRGSGVAARIRRGIAKGGNIMRSDPRREKAITKHAVKFGAAFGTALTAGSLTGHTPHPGAIAVGAVGGAALMAGIRAHDKWKAKRKAAREKGAAVREDYYASGATSLMSPNPGDNIADVDLDPKDKINKFKRKNKSIKK